MRAAFPMPRSLWPHEMVLTVDDDRALEELVWVRYALDLDPHDLDPRGSDVPPPIWNPPPLARRGVRPGDDRAELEQRWVRAWADALAARRRLEEALAALDAPRFSVGRQAAEREVRRRHRIRSWPRDVDQFEAWRGPFETWRRSLHAFVHERDPEREILRTTTAAWRRGLERIIELPTTGDYTRMLSPAALLVTRSTRADPLAYADALESFGRP